MNIRITDDFDLDKIIQSGQCFRPFKQNDGTFTFIDKSRILKIRQKSPHTYSVSCSRWQWNRYWKPYFHLDFNYAALEKAIPDDDLFLKHAAGASRGIRILRQDPWEMIISFIISQRKSIPAIQSSIEKLCRLCGTPIEGTDLFSFPSAEQIVSQSLDSLRGCSLGYRAPYILKTSSLFFEGKESIKKLAALSDASLLDALKELPGVGLKVASCVALFGFGRCEFAPVDVWIHKVIEQEYNGINPFPRYHEHAGIMQQYMFYYERLKQDKIKN